jgi:hypothetical protein
MMMNINRTIKLALALIALTTAMATAHPTTAQVTRVTSQVGWQATTGITAVHTSTLNIQRSLHLKTLIADNQKLTSG